MFREDWTIACYDSTLKLQWEKSISHQVHSMPHLIDFFEIGDIDLMIQPLTIEGNSDEETGVVVLGASMAKKSIESQKNLLTESMKDTL